MIPYILYTALILTACFAFYKLLLQKETFFGLNRVILIACMLLAFMLPLLPVPQQLSFRKIQTNEITGYNNSVAAVVPHINSVKQDINSPAVKLLQKPQVITLENIMKLLFYLYCLV